MVEAVATEPSERERDEVGEHAVEDVLADVAAEIHAEVQAERADAQRRRQSPRTDCGQIAERRTHRLVGAMLAISSRGRSQVNRNTASATNTKNTEKMMPR